MRLRRSSVPVLMWLMAVAITIRALIPAGYMPDMRALASGTVAMVVCTMNGPVTVQMDTDFDPQPHTSSDAADTGDHTLSCPFAVVAPGLLPYLDLMNVVYVLMLAASIRFTLLSFQYIRRRYQLSTQPRGPPVSLL